MTTGGMHYRYDNNRNKSIPMDKDKFPALYHYNKFNQLTDDYGGSVTASYTYNADNELGKEFRITGIQILHCFLTNILTVNKEI